MKWQILPSIALAIALLPPAVVAGQTPTGQEPVNGKPAAPSGAALPPGYVIGADDILLIVFWREKDMSAEVVVRPDGKISLPLLNDIDAAGHTPEALRVQIEKAAAKYLAEPNAAVVVKAVNSRKAFITGNVLKPGAYPLTADMTVLQLIAIAGGLQEYADAKNIVVMRRENGVDQHFKVNYKDIVRQKNLARNIVLKPGDTVVVP